MSKTLTSDRIPELLHRFQSGRILLATHLRPDGDALGSLCGMMLLLQRQGFQADALLPESVPDYYQEFLPEKGLLKETEVRLSDYALILVLDAARRDRVAAAMIASGEQLPIPLLVVDHHPDNPQFGDWNCIVPQAAADSEIIADMALKAKWEITPAAATHLLIGILTDSGSFRFTNTTPQTLRTAANLMEAGGEYQRIMNACYFSKPENMARFEADLLCNHLKKACGGRFIYAYLAPELLDRYGIELRNTEQTIEILRAVSGPAIAATIRKEPDGFKCSLRSKDPRYSVGRIARSIGGGGHEMAAGCTIPVPAFEQAEQILLEYVEKEINENPS
ncbi:MAG: bifunctional oligoribonuclease/PAP phosphatase NrnA [Lentisphaeria bacterium]|nr:bifunctional oligoribonuclease/PAP phosphatase NrnA [Lentisphaeria bacterium]